MTEDPQFVLWAHDYAPPPDTPALLWSSFGYKTQHPKSVSLPKYIENHARIIRAELLSYFSNAKFVSDGNRSLEDALSTPEGLSSWWLSFPSLKVWRGQSIPTACKLIALERIVGNGHFHHLRIEAPHELRELIARVLYQKSSWRYNMQSFTSRWLIHPTRAVGSLLRYQYQTRHLPKKRLGSSEVNRQDFAFFDYFTDNGSRAGSNQTYKSPYWGDVPQFVKNPNWYHIYPRNVDATGIHLAQESIRLLNEGRVSQHSLFLGRLHLNDLSRICRTFIKQVSTHRKFRRRLLEFKNANSGLALWNVFENEWNDSIIGSTGLRHLILLSTTNSLVCSMPTYSKVFYLMENQPWELALLHCIRKHKKGILVGVAHSTIRFWDLRYFIDSLENPLLESNSSRPHPDHILVNSESARRHLLENGFPEVSVSIVEALRYMYLLELQNSLSQRKDHVLLLGDFLEQANSSLISVFRKAVEQLSFTLPIKIRSHPICPMTPTQLGALSTCVSGDDLSHLLRHAFVTVTNAASSSAADSVSLGIPTIIVLDGMFLNYSPFLQNESVYFVEDAAQLACLLGDFRNLKSPQSASIFCLDPHYPRWRKVLSPT